MPVPIATIPAGANHAPMAVPSAGHALKAAQTAAKDAAKDVPKAAVLAAIPGVSEETARNVTRRPESVWM